MTIFYISNMTKHAILLFSSLLILLFLSSSSKGFSQTLEAKTIAIDTNCNGFYQYLPRNYNKHKKYPLLIFLHGLGELGNGPSDLPKVTRNGVLKLIQDGAFPDSFLVNGKEYRFIIFAPQFIHWPWPKTTQAIVDYAVKHYAVDKKRIYITGLSMGGGALWECIGNSKKYAKKVAAVVPICGASLADSIKAQTIARSNVAVWATHNEGDRTVTVEYTHKYIRYINSAPVPPKLEARKTIFPEKGHNAWSKTYDPLFKENGLNVYEWMLSHHR
jgi:predicted peptidase